MSRRPLRIGLSARIYHPLPGATGIQSKALQYLEQSVAHWVMSREVMVFMIPVRWRRPTRRRDSAPAVMCEPI